MILVSITEAKRDLEELLERVSGGERVVITKYGKPKVEIIEIDKGNLYRLVKLTSSSCLLNQG